MQVLRSWGMVGGIIVVSIRVDVVEDPFLLLINVIGVQNKLVKVREVWGVVRGGQG